MSITHKIFVPILGLLAGIISGLLGTGGGMIIVPSLMRLGMNQKYAHAASVCTMLPICFTSTVMYIISGTLSVEDAFPYLPYGIIGAITGSIILPKINQNILRKIFGCFSIWAAFKLLTR